MFDVRIISDRKEDGFVAYDDGEYINVTSSKSVSEAVDTIAKKYNLDVSKLDMSEVEDDYACFDFMINNTCYTVDIDG